jgi:hypothetical protein
VPGPSSPLPWAFATGALRNHYKKPASLDLRVSRDEVTQTVDEVTHEKPAAPDRFVDESATRPRDRPALQASLGACRTLPKPEGDTAPAASP